MNIHNPVDLISDAEQALSFLKDGNERFVSGKLRYHSNQKRDRRLLVGGQQPFAVVFCCSDSRVVPEIFFDQRLGDIFVIRNAGNVVNPAVLGSIEYSVEHLGSPLVVVVGHKNCGAVTAACAGGDLPPNIASVANVIKPAIKKNSTITEVVRNHAIRMADEIKKDKIIKKCKATVVSAYYDIESGVVTWL